MRAHSYAAHAAQQTDAAWGTRNNYDVVAWPDQLQPKTLLRLDDEPAIVLKEATPAVVTTKFAPHDWGAALTLEGLRLSANRYPERAVLSEKSWRSMHLKQA
ncbi:MAG: hypothetical protein HC859_03670 [Bacteroidia bacterium]|nr:hypothetical protein [Bacteroidia bacterium]